MKSILDYETVSLIDEDDALEIIDQTLLPGRIEIIRLHTAKEIWDAKMSEELRVRVISEPQE